MKTLRQSILSLPRGLCAGAASAALICMPAGLAQVATIIRIAPPGNPAFITGLNENGNVAGYYHDANLREHAFFWSDTGAIDLGTLGGTRSAALALNNFDQVAGYSSLPGDTEFRGFIWTFGFMFGSDTLGGTSSVATAINDASQLTGYSYVSPLAPDYHAVRGFGAQWEDLGTLGGKTSLGIAINESGQVAGHSTLSGDIVGHAFLFDGRTMRDLGTLGGSSSLSQGLNDHGWVVGSSTLAGNAETRAFVYDGVAMRGLGTLGGTRSLGRAINNAGQAIGDATTVDDAEFRGFIWSNGSMRDLGTLGGGFSSVRDVNNLGQVVGVSSNALGQSRAFIWDNGIIRDLNAFLPANSGWNLQEALFINEARQVVGRGLFQGQGAWFRISVTGTPNSPPVAIAGSDQTVACAGSTTPVTINGSASSDPDGDPLTFEWFEGTILLGNASVLNVALAPGSHAIVLRVTDPSGARSEDIVVVNIVDTTPPVVECPANLTLTAGEDCGASVPDFLANLVAFDACTPVASLVKNQAPPAGTRLGLGTHAVSITVTDAAGNVTTCVVQATIADRTAPAVQCPANLTLAAGEDCGANVPDFLASLAASDLCTPVALLVKDQAPPAGTQLGLGTHSVTITVADPSGNVTTCIVQVTVADQTSPVVQCPADVTVPVGQDGRAAIPDFLAGLNASDACTPAAQLIKQQVPSAGTSVGAGTQPVTVTVADAAGNVATCVVQVTIGDRTAPIITAIVADPVELRPINRQLVPVTIVVEASDDSDPEPACRIVSVSSSEAVVATSDNKNPDWVITGDLTLKLRAENISKDAPRIYTVTIACTDASGNQSTGIVTITAAKNRDFDVNDLRGVTRRKKAGDTGENRYEKKIGGNKGSERSRR